MSSIVISVVILCDYYLVFFTNYVCFIYKVITFVSDRLGDRLSDQVIYHFVYQLKLKIMEAISMLSSLILVTAAGFVVIRILEFFYKLHIKSDIKLTNTKTGKSVTLGKHPNKEQAKKLLEVIN